MKDRHGTPIWVYDLEVFPDFFLATFKWGKIWRRYVISEVPGSTSMLAKLGLMPISKLVEWLQDPETKVVLAGFNSFEYDDVILRYVLRNPACSPADIFKLSKMIIEEDHNQVVFKMKYSATLWEYSIDIFQLLNKKGSLKEWMCREAAPVVMESSASFLEPLPLSEVEPVTRYCGNDVMGTEDLLKKRWHLVTIRDNLNDIYDLGNNIYRMSEAGIAQHTFMELHNRRTGQYSNKVREAAQASTDNRARVWPLDQIISKRVQFNTPPYKQLLADLLATRLVGNPMGTTWTIEAEQFKKPVQLGLKQYQLGTGGIHSIDGPGIFYDDEQKAIVDLDVTSYYPSIIIEEGLYPKHMGVSFCKDMTGLRDTRVEAKRKKDMKTADALRIVINSSFGKLNDFYSPMRSIPSALRVTVNGQLMMLMAIERLESMGAEILSSNTDGVTIRWDRVDLEMNLPEIMDWWKGLTCHNLERTDFKAYCRRDINNYVVLKSDGKPKYKGVFDPEPKDGKWDAVVVRKAAEEYLLHGNAPEDTIRSEQRAASFLYYQRVGSGGSMEADGVDVGRLARWYIGRRGVQLVRHYASDKRSSQPNATNAVLAMDITDWDILGVPPDLDFKHYITEAWDLINSVKPKPPKIKRIKA